WNARRLPAAGVRLAALDGRESDVIVLCGRGRTNDRGGRGDRVPGVGTHDDVALLADQGIREVDIAPDGVRISGVQGSHLPRDGPEDPRQLQERAESVFDR